jgi:hypothetical protein
MPMTTDLLERVTDEIEQLHAFFVTWFNGTAVDSDDVFDRGFVDRMAPQGTLIQPGGERKQLGDLAEGMRRAHRSSPNFDIRVRNARLEHVTPELVIATYEEWQRGAINSEPPSNGRLSTVVFLRESERLRWLHIHETWLPSDVAAKAETLFI